MADDKPRRTRWICKLDQVTLLEGWIHNNMSQSRQEKGHSKCALQV
jgi:hypothetical protein